MLLLNSPGDPLDCDKMPIGSSEDHPLHSTNGRRPSILSMKFRLHEERKKVLRISSTKYHSIEDHEIGMRRFCLIKNTLQKLQRETREEKLARHAAKTNNVSPSYLSASRPRSPSPPCDDMEVADVLSNYDQQASFTITGQSDDEDEMPHIKRPRLHLDNHLEESNKENSAEDRLIDVVGVKDDHCPMNGTQSHLRDLDGNYNGECSSPLSTKSDTHYNTGLCYNTTDHYSNTPSSYNYSLSTIVNYNNCQNSCRSYLNNGRCFSLSGCGNSTFQGNDLQSVVYQSLITSL